VNLVAPAAIPNAAIGEVLKMFYSAVIPESAVRAYPGPMNTDRLRMSYWVYMLASHHFGTLYVGVTGRLTDRVADHKAKVHAGFTAKYGVDRLVWYQGFGEVTEAIAFEKRLKRWRREWKVQLIEADNPQWQDLYIDLMTPLPAPSVFMGPGLSLTRKPG
jgi:putative endonuclease